MYPIIGVFWFWNCHNGSRIIGISVHNGPVKIVKEGGEAVKIRHGDRIKFVVMARGASHGQSHENSSCGLHAVLCVDRPVFFVDGSAFAGGGVASIKASSKPLIEGGFWQQIARDLLDSELVERLVVVECFYDPVAIGPYFAIVVQMEAVRVCVASSVEPDTSLVLAVGVAIQQPVHESLVGVG